MEKIKDGEKVRVMEKRWNLLKKKLVLLNDGTPCEWLVNWLKLIPKQATFTISTIGETSCFWRLPRNWSALSYLSVSKKHILIKGIFALKLALQKPRDNGLGSLAIFVDSAKAFDSIPRETLYRVLEKFGFPPKLKRIIIDLHSDLIVKIQSVDSNVEFASAGGVKQWCTMAPILFLIYMQAAIELVNA